MIIQTPERQEAYEHRPKTYNKNKKGGVETAPLTNRTSATPVKPRLR